MRDKIANGKLSIPKRGCECYIQPGIFYQLRRRFPIINSIIDQFLDDFTRVNLDKSCDAYGYELRQIRIF